MKRKKKTPKAVTLLTKIEMLLADVVNECAVIEKGLEKNARLLLRSAEASIAAAKDYFITLEPSKVGRRIAKRPAHVSHHRVASRRTKAPVAAKKRPIARVARKAA